MQTGRRPALRATLLAAQPPPHCAPTSRRRAGRRRGARRVPAAPHQQTSRRRARRAHPQTGRPSYLVVELKQWSERRRGSRTATPSCGSTATATTPSPHPAGAGPRLRATTSPTSSSASPKTTRAGVGAAYLHNATDLGVSDLWDMEAARTGGRPDVHRAATAVTSSTSCAAPSTPEVPGRRYADALLASQVAPSKQLLAVAATRSRSASSSCCSTSSATPTSWCCTRSSRRAAATPRRRSSSAADPAAARASSPCRVHGRAGAAGTGRHARHRLAVVHPDAAQGRRARAPRVRKLFSYFNSFIAAEPNELDVPDPRRGAPHPGDVGVAVHPQGAPHRPAPARRAAQRRAGAGLPARPEPGRAARARWARPRTSPRTPRQLGMDVHEIDLDDQFRCGGSARYVEWVERLLGLAPGGPQPWDGDDRVRGARRGLARRARARAGACGRTTATPRGWRPATAGRGATREPDGTLVQDVRIGDWSRPWNLKGDRAVGGAPAGRAVGDRSGRLRAGRVHLHRAGLRVRPRRHHHRPRPRLARRPLGRRARGQPGPGAAQPHEGVGPRLRPAGAQRLQGAADPRACRASASTPPTHRPGTSSGARPG